ncbi:MAG: hypothetical protein GX219_03740, partial [Tissierellia bacterium]|nr:hypothetical protein [Tissierellia bacterium]
MTYLVMECHKSYAVVLDNEGRFIKVANLGYEIGDRIDFVIKTSEPKSKSNVIKLNSPVIRLITAAASFMLIFLGAWNVLFATYGTVQMTINPEVKISINKIDYVVGLEGLNEDGKGLISDLNYFGKKYQILADEIANKAIEKGYLSDNGEIKLLVDSKNLNWKTNVEDILILELEVNLDNKIKITISGKNEDDLDDDEKEKIIIPIQPDSIDDSLEEIKPEKPKMPNNYSNDNDEYDDDDDDDDDYEDDDDN